MVDIILTFITIYSVLKTFVGNYYAKLDFLNVLPLDKKIQKLNNKNVKEKSFLKPNYTRDENLTDFW